MSEQRPAVQNAADRGQVRHAERKDRDRRERELRDLNAVLATPEGRRVMWRLLGHCRVFESIWHPSALIHANSGKQDVGHFIMAEIAAADQEALFLMMKESSDAAKRDDAERQAVQQNKKDTT